ncbi:hypothetical protein PC118_g10851 [Phytophthora cactorum]|uniref:Uncharacterized protein n=1 Tax=Phytophthora cactorum TaxID=29920 RepID=A0A8T1G4S5_9STRA|nr:hypothetical protein PC111_g13221 [Phytophthora cactorum]KAG2826679.1 hypothetical protein PC112_g9176 [Phytophthora cactorum]KAG2858379.1 hypothetical protein PC113_g9865 [Phytophthora cactorum]KAG2884453.1 hypothetical protein PC114_g20081 [Phytophthora cactorum]KAG2892586.1 hypothetical protein PC115_g18752 [Phytophthora cactorum]
MPEKDFSEHWSNDMLLHLVRCSHYHKATNRKNAQVPVCKWGAKMSQRQRKVFSVLKGRVGERRASKYYFAACSKTRHHVSL